MNVLEILTSPWAIQPEKLHEIQAIYAAHLRGEGIDIDAVEARLGRPLASEQQDYTVREGGVAVLAIEGVIAAKANMFTRISGGASAQLLSTQLESAAVDARVQSIILNIDSPGGSVFGTPEFAATVRDVALIKPVVTLSDQLMASAAYWFGSASNAVFITGPTVFVGSIGVLQTHDYSPASSGRTTTEITAGRYKRMASDNAPLNDEGRAYLQARVDHVYSVFVEAVAAHRGVDVNTVLERMADGRVFVGQQAIDAGLVDGFSSLDALAEQLATDPSRYAKRGRAVFAPAPSSKPSHAAALLPSPSIQPLRKGPAMSVTREQLAAESPEVLAAIQSESSLSAATAERARIRDVEAQSIPGHEALIASLKFDGKTTGPEAAVAVLAAEKASRRTAAADLASDAPKAVLPVAADPMDRAPKPDLSTPVEARSQAEWDGSAEVRGEFGTLAAFTAYRRAEENGNVRTLGKRAA